MSSSNPGKANVQLQVWKSYNESSDVWSFESGAPTLDNESICTPTESISDEKEYVLLSKPIAPSNRLELEIRPLPDNNSIIVSVRPPRVPVIALDHVPCDIVLVIDVSGSMSAEAPAPSSDPSTRERNGLTVLDLTKHAARTILETLDSRDRLGLVTFSTEAKVVQRLVPMTKENKSEVLDKIAALKVDSMTNLWHGILEGKSQVFSVLWISA